MKQQVAGGAAMVSVAVVIWGVQFPVAMDLFALIEPVNVAAIRSAVGALLLLAILGLVEGRAAIGYQGKAAQASVLGVVGTCASPLLMFWGMSFSRPEHAAILVALQPSIAAVAVWLLRGRRPPTFSIGCIAIAFAGVVLLVTKGTGISLGGQELAGDAIILLGSVCGAIYNLGAERLSGWSPLRLATLTIMPGAIAGVLLAQLLSLAGWIETPQAHTLASAWRELAYLSVAGVTIAMLCFVAGLQQVGALNAMLIMNLTPVVTFLMRFLQGEQYLWVELAGGAIVVGALIANNLYLRRQWAKKAARGTA